MAVNVAELTAKLVMDTSGFTAGLRRATAAANQFSKSTEHAAGAGGAIKAHADQMNEVATSTRDAADATRDAAQSAKEAADEHSKLGGALDVGGKGFDLLGRASQLASSTMSGMVGTVADIATVFRAFGGHIGEVTLRVATLTAAAATMAGASLVLGATIGRATPLLLRFAAGAAASGAAMQGVQRGLVGGLGTVATAAAQFTGRMGAMSGIAMGAIAMFAKLGTAGSILAVIIGIKLVSALASFIAKLPAFIGASVAAFSDLIEQVSAARVTFDGAGEQVVRFGLEASKSLALSGREALAATNIFGAFFDQAGLTTQATAQMSTSMVRLAGDLASFKNLKVEDALEKLRAGLAGETEPLRAVGVFLNETRVQAKATELGFHQLGGELTEGQKIVARYALIVEQTRKAQGDQARTAGSLANAQRQLSANTEHLKESVGRLFAPIKTLTTNALAALVNMADKVTNVVGGLASRLGNLYSRFTVNGRIISWVGGLLSKLSGANTDVTLTSAQLAKGLSMATAEMTQGILAVKDSEHQLDLFNQLLNDGNLVMAERIALQATGTEAEGRLKGALAEKKAVLASTIELEILNSRAMDEERRKVEALLPPTKDLNKERKKAAEAVLGAFSATQANANAQRNLNEAHHSAAEAQDKLNTLLARGAVDAKKVADAETELADASERLADAQQTLADAQAKLDDLLRPATVEEMADAEEKFGAALRDVTRAELALLDAHDQVRDATKAVAKAEQQIIDLHADAAENARKLGEAYAGTGGELSDFAQGLKSSLESVLDPMQKFDVIEKRWQAIEEATKSVTEAEYDLFDALAQGKVEAKAVEEASRKLVKAREAQAKLNETLGARGLRNNLEANNKALRSWLDNLNRISSRGFSGLARDLAALGPEGAAAVADLVVASDSELKGMADLFGDRAKLMSDEFVVGVSRALGDFGVSQDYVNGLLEDGNRISDDLADAYDDLAKRNRALERANLDLADANQGVIDANRNVVAAQENLNGVNNRSIIVTDQVAEAMRQVDDATRGVGKANDAYAEAQRNLDTARAGDPEFSKEVAAARREVESANWGVWQAEVAAAQAAADLVTAWDQVNGLDDTGPKNAVAKLLELGAIQGPLREELQKTWNTLASAPELRLRFKLTTTQEIIDFLRSHPEITGQQTFDLMGLQHGGIVTMPTLARLAENSRPEAIIPLDRLRDYFPMPDTTGGGGTTIINNVHVDVHGNVWKTRELVSEIHEQLLAKQRLGGSNRLN